jgi:hypothetical protein
MENLFIDREAVAPKKPVAQPIEHSSDSEGEVQTNMRVLYRLKGGKDEPSERIFRFTEMYLPDNKQRRQTMIAYNR